MKKKLLLLLIGFFMVFTIQAKVWRVNNTANSRPDFISLQAAVANASVVNDDTVYIEGSVTPYNSTFTMNKRLVVISTGYFLSGATGNTGLQANPNTALEHSAIFLDSLASGSKFLGFAQGGSGFFYINPGTDNVTLERSQVQLYFSGSASSNFVRLSNWTVNKCYITYWQWPVAFYAENLSLTNCILTGTNQIVAGNIISALVRNNLFYNVPVIYGNSYFTNNILVTNLTVDLSLSTVKNCIATGNLLPAGSGNQNSVSQNNLIVGPTGNSTDGQFQLKAGSPALGAGETVSGITPDCGPFGTSDPYRLSGIPPIPTIYSLTVPVSVPSSNTSMTITVSARSNN